jgi:hypothetical protein
MSLLLQRERSFFRLMIVDGNRTPLVSLPVGNPVGQGHEGVCSPHNIVPTPTKAPKGATHQQHGKAKQYPTAVWRRGADGKLGCGACLHGSKSNAVNLILRLFLYHFFT